MTQWGRPSVDCRRPILGRRHMLDRRLILKRFVAVPLTVPGSDAGRAGSCAGRPVLHGSDLSSQSPSKNGLLQSSIPYKEAHEVGKRLDCLTKPGL